MYLDIFSVVIFRWVRTVLSWAMFKLFRKTEIKILLLFLNLRRKPIQPWYGLYIYSIPGFAFSMKWIPVSGKSQDLSRALPWTAARDSFTVQKISWPPKKSSFLFSVQHRMTSIFYKAPCCDFPVEQCKKINCFFSFEVRKKEWISHVFTILSKY